MFQLLLRGQSIEVCCGWFLANSSIITRRPERRAYTKGAEEGGMTRCTKHVGRPKAGSEISGSKSHVAISLLSGFFSSNTSCNVTFIIPSLATALLLISYACQSKFLLSMSASRVDVVYLETITKLSSCSSSCCCSPSEPGCSLGSCSYALRSGRKPISRTTSASASASAIQRARYACPDGCHSRFRRHRLYHRPRTLVNAVWRRQL